MLNRRKFIKAIAVSSAALYTAPLLGRNENTSNKLTILHTNDLHCHFEPFPETDPKYGGRGGMNRIAAYVKQMRKTNPNLLLFDSGDFSQGTPYYNFYKGEVILKLMSEMRYNASTMGNHEFDNGLDSFKNKLQFANFPIVSSNYDFSRTPLNGLIKQNIVIEQNNYRIGVYGLGIELNGLVGKTLCGNTKYNEPIAVALEQEDYLRNNEKCDIIICLSHLGYKYDTPKVSDIVLAKKTRYTDAILGGHTHSFFDSPVEITNLEKNPVVINQVGWAALMLGQIDFFFENEKKTIIDFSDNKHVG